MTKLIILALLLAFLHLHDCRAVQDPPNEVVDDFAEQEPGTFSDTPEANSPAEVAAVEQTWEAPETLEASEYADEGETSTGRKLGWSPYFSEENGGYSERMRNPVRKIHCNGKYCDNKLLYSSSPINLDRSNSRWTNWFSEENGGRGLCPDKYTMSQIQCKGKYCDDMRLRCDRIPSTHWRSSVFGLHFTFSDEEGTRGCPGESVIVGIKCFGSKLSRRSIAR